MSPQKLATSHPSNLRHLPAEGIVPPRDPDAPMDGYWESQRSKSRQPFVSPVEIPPANPHIHSIDYTSPLETPIWRFGAALVGQATPGGGISCRSSDEIGRA